MRAVLVGRTRLLERLFSVPALATMSAQDFEAGLSRPESDEIFYLDAGAFNRRAWDELVSRLSAGAHLNWAVIDREQALADPASVFHAGALDLVSRDAPDGFVDERRLEAIMRFAEGRMPGGKYTVSRHQGSPDGTQQPQRNHRPRQAPFVSWDGLVEGRDYEFLMVFMALCDADGLHTRLGDTRFARLKVSFMAVAEGLAADRDGMVWISDGQCILELFRPDAAPRVIASCLRILANMPLVSYEQLRLDQETVSLCFSMCRAQAPWQKPGNTGTIVADSINFIFHLGRKFTPPGAIDLVDDLASGLPPRLAEHIVTAGMFEGKQVSRFPGFTLA